MLLHHIRFEDIDNLEVIFAVYGPDGWVIPPWLVLLRNTAQGETR